MDPSQFYIELLFFTVSKYKVAFFQKIKIEFCEKFFPWIRIGIEDFRILDPDPYNNSTGSASLVFSISSYILKLKKCFFYFRLYFVIKEMFFYFRLYFVINEMFFLFPPIFSNFINVFSISAYILKLNKCFFYFRVYDVNQCFESIFIESGS